jgi:general secretion pathway protein I
VPTNGLRATEVKIGRPRKQQGFTLIEAIVAMVLIATTGMALFSWINSNIITLSRVQDINATNTATANALEYLNTINPWATPEGKTELGPYQMNWKAIATTETRDGVAYPYSIGLYQINMYQTKVSLQKPDGQFWFAFELQQVGYKKVRVISNDF